MGIENTHKLIVNCLPLNEGERRAFAKAARDVPQEFVGDEAHRGDMVWSAAVPEELRSRATAVIGNFPVSQASQYTRLEWLQTFSAGVDAYIARVCCLAAPWSPMRAARMAKACRNTCSPPCGH